MIFQNLSRFNEIGASCYLIDTGDYRIILDSGLHPKYEGDEAMPRMEDIPENSIDAIVLTHAHLDHAGTIPVMMRRNPNAKLYLTPPTAKLANAMLHNSVNVMQSKREELGILDYPLFGHRELDTLEKRWELVGYNERIKLSNDIYVTLYDAGHILGSAGIFLEANGKTLFYTGDIQFDDQCLISGAKFPESGVDTLIVETTRGAAPRRPDYTRKAEQDKLCDAINHSLDKGGSALIPVFAMGKTQEILTMIHRFKEEGRIEKHVPVFIGGLSTKMTLIFDEFADSPYRSDEDFVIMEDMGLRSSSKKKKRAPINYQRRAIYALSSGMMTPKTVSNNFARTFINNKKNSLLFVGYADPLSPGGVIRQAERGSMITLDPEQEDVLFDCDLEIFDFSGHSTRDEILDYILKLNPKTAFLVHGDLEASEWFRQQLVMRAPDMEAMIPKPAKQYTL